MASYQGGAPASRGRGVSNTPAWMAREGGGDHRSDDYGRHRGGGDYRGGGGGGPPRGPPRDYHRAGGGHRGPPPGHHHHRGGSGPPRRRPNKNAIVFRSWEEERDWVQERRRKRQSRTTKWDVPPTQEQATLDAQASQLNNPAATDFVGSSLDSGLPQQTRHARRLYLGNLPHGLTEHQLQDFFYGAIRDALEAAEPLQENPILSVYINQERRFAFLEFKTVEMTTACLNLDGINVMGQGKVTIKRPNDYNPAMAPQVHPSALPNLNVAKLGIISTTVPDGPNKIFIGGLHYHLTEDQVLDILSVFGKVKAFHLLKNDDAMSSHMNTNYSKGYGFVEYADPHVTQVAVQGLHGMDLGGGKTLTARIAAAKDTPAVTMPASANGSSLIGGYNVEELLDAAMGLKPMPTAPTYGATMPAAAVPMGMMQMPPSGTMMNMPSQQPPTMAASAMDIANAALQAAFPQAQQPTPSSSPQTRILVLLNMVTDQDLSTVEDHHALSDEVRQECAKFGNLLSMKIPRPLEGYEPSAVHKIFLEYATAQDAATARGELSGRAFGTNVVEATYFPEEDYLANKLR